MYFFYIYSFKYFFYMEPHRLNFLGPPLTGLTHVGIHSHPCTHIHHLSRWCESEIQPVIFFFYPSLGGLGPSPLENEVNPD